MKGKLVRLESTNNNLRTNEIDGEFTEEPSPGSCFYMIGEPLTPGTDFRYVRTSTVKTVEHFPDGKIIRFTTLNSIYELHIAQF